MKTGNIKKDLENGVMVYISNSGKMTPTKDQIKNAGFMEHNLFAIPSDYKDRVKFLSNILKQIFDIPIPPMLQRPFDEDLRYELRLLSRTLCYLVNSSSFQRGKYFDFDKIEVNKKLGRNRVG